MDEYLKMRADERAHVTPETKAKLKAEREARAAQIQAELYDPMDVDPLTNDAFLKRLEEAEANRDTGGQHWEDPDAPRVTTWTPVDMAEALDKPPPMPEFLTYEDGSGALLYPGRDHIFYGPSESGKSWVTFIGAVQAAKTGHKVAIIDFEDDARGVGERLRLLGASAEILSDQDRFRYVNPHEPVGPDRSGRFPPGAGGLTELVQWEPDVVVIDAVTEGLAIEGLSEMSATDVAKWFGLISRRFREAGAAVTLIDHTAKGTSDGKPTELGSQHKRGGLNGASFFVDVVRRPGRALGADPVSGLLRLRLAKDRAGALRGRYPGEFPVVADIELTSWPDGGVTWHVLPGNQSATTTVDELAAEIFEYLVVSGGKPGEPGESIGAIAQGIGRSRTDAAAGRKLTEMVLAGYLTKTPGPRGAKMHALTDVGMHHYGGGEDAEQ